MYYITFSPLSSYHDCSTAGTIFTEIITNLSLILSQNMHFFLALLELSIPKINFEFAADRVCW